MSQGAGDVNRLTKRKTNSAEPITSLQKSLKNWGELGHKSAVMVPSSGERRHYRAADASPECHHRGCMLTPAWFDPQGADPTIVRAWPCEDPEQVVDELRAEVGIEPFAEVDEWLPSQADRLATSRGSSGRSGGRCPLESMALL
jgi:hypothetical protein